MRGRGPLGVLLAVALATALLGGCAVRAGVPTPHVTVPTPMPLVETQRPSGTPSPIAPAECTESEPVLSPMPPPGRMPTGTAMAAIKKRGYLIAGVDQDAYAWSYVVPSPSADYGDRYRGFDADMVHALAWAIFGDKNADRVHFVPVGEDYRLGATDDGIVDVVASSITVNCDRLEQHHVKFSADYFDAAQKLLVPRDSKDIRVEVDPDTGVPAIKGLNKGTVCTLGTTTSVTNLTALAKAGDFRILLARNWSDCLLLMQQGKVQAFSTDNNILGGMQAEDPNLKVVGDAFSVEPHGLAFPSRDHHTGGSAEFVGFANGVLAQMEAPGQNNHCPQPMQAGDDSCWMALYRTWVEPQLKSTSAPPTPSYSP